MEIIPENHYQFQLNPTRATERKPVASKEHLKTIQNGVAGWNRWRHKNPPPLRVDLRGAILTKADLSLADLRLADLNNADLTEAKLNAANLDRANLAGADLVGADLKKANLRKADLRGAILNGTSFEKANLRGANLSSAKLRGAQLIETDLCDATLTGSRVYGVSAWNIKVNDRTEQENLIISGPDESVITADNIKVAQFIYLLLNNQEIRNVIDTITSKAVLILGRFTPKRKKVLNAIRNALRERGYLPLLFDFKRPTDRDFTETIMTLAGMSAFVIADITKPSSCPFELRAAVPNYRIPFVPILQVGEKPFSMFRDLSGAFHWVLPLLRYNSCDKLLAALDKAVIAPVLEKRRELALMKAQEMPTRHVRDYISSDEPPFPDKHE